MSDWHPHDIDLIDPRIGTTEIYTETTTREQLLKSRPVLGDGTNGRVLSLSLNLKDVDCANDSINFISSLLAQLLTKIKYFADFQQNFPLFMYVG